MRDELGSTVLGQLSVNSFCGQQHETSHYKKEILTGQVNEYQLLT